ncbi:MAG: hypothetical protein J7498_05565 [Sphingobium sp.]|nr:hypothetical protein [Sphingobium sp.]
MSWTARDWRQFTALTLLALAAIPLTLISAMSRVIIYLQPHNSFAFYLGLSNDVLILVDLVCVGTILGRRTFKIKVGDNEINADGGDGERVLNQGDAA